VAVSRSGNDTEHYKEVTLYQAWLVLGWVTVFRQAHTSLCNHPPRQLSLLPSAGWWI